MPVKILMPALSPTMSEGKLAKWHVAEGDTVESGDVLAEIETDKATMEVEAVDEGVIGKIIVAEGTDNVPVNDLIAVLLEEDEDASAVDAFLAGAGTTASVPAPDVTPPPAPAQPVEPKAETSAPVAPKANGKTDGRVFATPLARRLAKEKGIDLSQLTGSGPHGRIIKSDIEGGAVAPSSATSAPVSQAVSPPAAASAPAIAASTGPDAKQLADMLGMPYRAEPNSKVRQTIAQRLTESKQTVPHYYLTVDCHLDALLAARKEINDHADGYKLSVNDFIIKAAALALKKKPNANVSWTDDAMLFYERADISVAVATENGLITPIIKEAETKSLRQISTEMKELALKAREGKLKPEEYQGGTFTISNLGMFGIREFSAIINPPQSCILAVGAGEKRPVVLGEEIVPATVMSCTASFDHRSIDGAVGAEFLSTFKELIESPLALLA